MHAFDRFNLALRLAAEGVSTSRGDRNQRGMMTHRRFHALHMRTVLMRHRRRMAQMGMRVADQAPGLASGRGTPNITNCCPARRAQKHYRQEHRKCALPRHTPIVTRFVSGRIDMQPTCTRPCWTRRLGATEPRRCDRDLFHLSPRSRRRRSWARSYRQSSVVYRQPYSVHRLT